MTCLALPCLSYNYSYVIRIKGLTGHLEGEKKRHDCIPGRALLEVVVRTKMFLFSLRDPQQGKYKIINASLHYVYICGKGQEKLAMMENVLCQFNIVSCQAC